MHSGSAPYYGEKYKVNGGTLILISIEILKSYGFRILVASNDYDSTQNRWLKKSGKIVHLSFCYTNLP